MDLGVIGNCNVAALVDSTASIVWCCLPQLDGDPVFCKLLDGGPKREGADDGVFRIELDGMTRSEQRYLPNTAVLETRLYDGHGGSIEIIDFAPRFKQWNRYFRPMTLVRIVRLLSGTPRIRVVLEPRFAYGATVPARTHGSNHVRFVGPDLTVRLYTDVAIPYVLESRPFLLDGGGATFIFGADESLTAPIGETAREFLDYTVNYWRDWVHGLAIPAEWQQEVIRAAITLKICALEQTGAIVAAMTTSIPEAPDSGRNWDYRYCWLRDSFFVVRALNRLAAVTTMENYLRYVLNLVSTAENNHLQPVYGLSLESRLTEFEVPGLAGYRGMGPVRVGNQAFEHAQHDVYGNVILACAQAFLDHRLRSPAGLPEYERLEWLGERAFEVHDAPDAGMWEFRSRNRVHTTSSLMCWAGLDRLATVARHLGLEGRAALWRDRAEKVRAAIETKAWNADAGAFVESFGGSGIDGGVLLMAEVGFLKRDDPRFESTVRAVERALRRGDHLMRYGEADDFWRPKVAFNACTFWFIEALAVLGHVDEAREIFERILACRNHLGLLSEDIDPETGELWGNFPQTYSMVGIINCAMRLSRKWEDLL
ncbi:MAG: glycoside hydrolase family 15 protein [Proteobacteria bacterium]|nr:glycoside hydrolase family 15 protein [Pseudomonadota bacterium]